MKDLRLSRRHPAEIYLLLGLAVLCSGIVTICTVNSLHWIGKTFPGFLMMENRVVPSAGLFHWTGLTADNIFMCEVVSVDGAPVRSPQGLRAYVGATPPGTRHEYIFRRGDDTFPLAIASMRFTGRDYLLLFASYLANGIAFMIIGFVIRLVRPNQPASLPLLLAMLFSGLWAVTACDLYGPYWFFIIHVVFESFMPAAIIHLGLVFPEPSNLIRRRPRLILLPYAFAAVLTATYEINLQRPDLYVVNHNGATIFLGFSLLLSLAMIAAAYLRTTSMLTRQRVRILLLGYFSGLMLPALIVIGAVLLDGALSFTQIALFTILWPLSVGYAILKHNFFDIDEVVKRSIYYISLTSTMLMLYLAILFLLNRFFQAYALAQSRYFPLFFCAAILIVFNPLRERLQRLVDRVFFRIRYDFRETVERVSSIMTSLLNTDEIANTLLSAVEEAMQIGLGVVVLQDGESERLLVFRTGRDDRGPMAGDDRRRYAALLKKVQESPRVLNRYDIEEDADKDSHGAEALSLMTSLGLIMVVPILFKSATIGSFGVGVKKSGRAYSRLDLDLLVTLANQSAVAFANAGTYRELENLNLNLEGLVTDRTQELAESKKKLEASYDKLKELDRLKSQFFSNVGHELRTPLTLSLSPLESILQGEMGSLEADQRIMLGTIHRNVLKLLNLVSNLLDFSKIEAGRFRLHIGRHPLIPFLEQIVEPFRLAAEKKGIQLEFDASNARPPGPELYFDRDRMEKVFANLLSNALKFTPAPGAIRMAVTETEETVNVTVSDTGLGIPSEDLPRIFERFYQAGSREARRITGTGIGLSLVREFVELHKGNVTVCSAEGHGTIFVVSLHKGKQHLPSDEVDEIEEGEEGIITDTGRSLTLLEAENEQTVLPDAGISAAQALPEKAGRILVVEDNPEMRHFLRSILQKHYRVLEAEHGVQAIEICRRDPPDLILSDVSMPFMNGFELCREVKQDANLRHVPFLLVTSRTEARYRIEGFESGADEYIGKPFNIRELDVRIRSMIALRETQRKLKGALDELQTAYEELKATQVQLVQSEKMASVGQLAAGMAHELNNPLSFVYANVQVLREYVEAIKKCLAAYREAPLEPQDAERLERFWRENDMEYILQDLNSLLDGCHEGASRTKQIIADLRTFTRLGGSDRKIVDLNENMRSTLSLISTGLRQSIRIHIELAEGIPKVDCYPSQINQVFMNLMTNAVYATQGSGDIWVRSRHVDPGHVEFQVEDNGIGIPPDAIGRIFDPFFTTKPVGEGMGLGLSISFGIVQRHGGELTVKSEPGKGACFTMRIPMAPGLESVER